VGSARLVSPSPNWWSPFRAQASGVAASGAIGAGDHHGGRTSIDPGRLFTVLQLPDRPLIHGPLLPRHAPGAGGSADHHRCPRLAVGLIRDPGTSVMFSQVSPGNWRSKASLGRLDGDLPSLNAPISRPGASPLGWQSAKPATCCCGRNWEPAPCIAIPLIALLVAQEPQRNR